MINYVIYSHTDYLDILKIQTDYNQDKGHRTLLLNSSGYELAKDICDRYERVILYDDSNVYATRLLSCFEKIPEDYFVLLHEFDILLNVDYNSVSYLFEFLRKNNFDRIDLKHTFNLNSSLIIDISSKVGKPISLVKSEDPIDYIYNVNPSIWKRDSYIDVLSQFRSANYREIECVAQNHCKKFNIFKMHSPEFIECGWFFCLEIFKYLHITHSGKILPLNSEFMTPSRQSYASVAKEYTEMYNKYNLGSIQLKHYLP